jgi:hypothetical protein
VKKTHQRQFKASSVSVDVPYSRTCEVLRGFRNCSKYGRNGQNTAEDCRKCRCCFCACARPLKIGCIAYFGWFRPYSGDSGIRNPVCWHLKIGVSICDFFWSILKVFLLYKVCFWVIYGCICIWSIITRFKNIFWSGSVYPVRGFASDWVHWPWSKNVLKPLNNIL